MKKWLKITLISLGSLLGLVIIVGAIAMYLIFTPARLTSIVNKVGDKFILCENHFENVDLTLFKTFPNAGLVVDNVVLVNPLEGNPNDTVAQLHQLTVAINVREYLRHDHIKVEKLLIDGVEANLMIDSLGRSNFDIFATNEEEEEEEEKEVNIPDIDIHTLKINDLNCKFDNRKGNMLAIVSNANLNLKGTLQEDITDVKAHLKLDSAYVMTNDTLMPKEMKATLRDINAVVTTDGNLNKVLNGNLHLKVDKGDVCVNGVNYVTDALREQKKAFIEAEIPFRLDEMRDIYAVEAGFALTQFGVKLTAEVALPNDEREMVIESDFRTANWDVEELLKVLPEEQKTWAKGMDIGASLKFQGHASFCSDSTYNSAVSAHVIVDKGRFKAPKILPYDLSKIGADMEVYIGLAKQPSWVEIGRLEAHTGQNMVKLNGKIDDLLKDMNMNFNLKSHLKLSDLEPFLPDSLALNMNGDADLNLYAKTNLEQLTNVDLSKMRVHGSIALNDLDVVFDSISAQSDHLALNVNLPAKKHTDKFKELLSAEVNTGMLHAVVPSAKLDANIHATDLEVGISNFMDSTVPLSIAANFKFDKLHAVMDTITAEINQPKGKFEMVSDAKNKGRVQYHIDYNSRTILADMGSDMNINLGGLSVKGNADYDSTRSNVLKQWSPNLDVAIMRGVVSAKQLPYTVQMPDFKFNYQPELCELSNANIVFGNSDFYLTGKVNGLEDWISHEGMLTGDLDFTSNYTNVDDLMDALSGLGSDKDTIEEQRAKENVPKEANPFIVPKDVDFILHTNIRDAYAFDNELQDLAGDVRICDGVAVLDQVGFVCKAATMQLTALYKTPRPNHIFLGMDFHLLDIEIDELIDMIPYVDTLVPMLNSFDGNANFHLAAETYLNAYYQPKMSTMRGAAAISAKDLVVLDSETFDKIAKLMMFKKKTENKFDSLDVEMTLFRKEIEMYPSMLSMDKYKVCVSGFQSLDNNCNYHLEILKSPLPVRLAVDVKGIKPFKIGLGKVKYADLYRPEKRNAVEEQTLALKNMIRQSLEDNVRQSTKDLRKGDD